MKLILNLVSLVAFGVATVVASTSAQAQAMPWPQKPVTIVVPFAAGTSVDIVARRLANALTKDLGQQVLIDNKAGAGGTIGAGAVARSAPDGYTFVFGTISTHAINPSLLKNLTYDPVKDFAPVAGYAEAASILTINPTVGAKNLSEFLEVGRSRTIKFASTSVGSVGQLGAVLLGREAKVETLIVPYTDGSRAVIDLIRGEIDATLYTFPAIAAHIQAGKVIPIAVTGNKRLAALPDVPTFAERGLPKVIITAWYAVYAPKNTPQDIVDRMNKAVNAALKTAEISEKLSADGMSPLGGTAQELAAYTNSEIDRFAKLIEAAGIPKQ